MGSGMREGSRWSVFDGVKAFPSTPETLMSQIDSSITALEFAHATTLLHSYLSPSSSSSSSSSSSMKISDVEESRTQYDAQLADEAYKAGCAALASRKLDEALHSLQISLSKCPPDKTSAIAKLQSLISLTSKQLQKSPR